MSEKNSDEHSGKFIELHATRDMIYSDMLKGALEEEGIVCLVKRATGIHGQYGASLPGDLAMFRIYVTEEDYEEANNIKEQILGENEED
ncbi:MAG: hypothetical protein GF315_04595 [candidate division Zixibacteria bacterium]|nr:hypothetical protein [candidate division Zixibacteria bacterium]